MEPRLISFPKIEDRRGNLTFIESFNHIPFDIKRVYYLYDVPGGSERGGHAHKICHVCLIAMSGSFDVLIDTGRKKESFHLNRSYYGLYLPPLTWRELVNFSSGSVCLALASQPYDPDGYHRDYSEFCRAVQAE